MDKSLASQLYATINNEDLCMEFKAFLRGRHCEENLLFWIDVEMFQSEIYTPSDIIEPKATQIYEKYLSESAKHYINIDSELYNNLAKQIEKNISRAMFNEAQEQIFKLLETSCIASFLAAREQLKRTNSRKGIARASSFSKISSDSLMVFKYFQGKETSTTVLQAPVPKRQRRSWSFFNRSWRKTPPSPIADRKSSFLEAGHRKSGY